jgi:hypothetical protein
MKKIFSLLLLFTAFLGQAQTYQNVLDLINTNLQSGTKITAVKHREVEIALLDYIQANLSQSGDIKPIKADTAYLNANFEANGLGKNLRLGWAICNGNNGTPNIGGRVIVGYGTGFTTLNEIGGEKEHTLTLPEIPVHSHGLPIQVGGSLNIPSLTETGSNNESYSETNRTTNAGGGLPHNNMPPYIVQIYIMKL